VEIALSNLKIKKKILKNLGKKMATSNFDVELKFSLFKKLRTLRYGIFTTIRL